MMKTSADQMTTLTMSQGERAAFVIVFLVAVHSMLEYPLWYSYFLLPTAFAFGVVKKFGDDNGGVLTSNMVEVYGQFERGVYAALNA